MPEGEVVQHNRGGKLARRFESAQRHFAVWAAEMEFPN